MIETRGALSSRVWVSVPSSSRATPLHEGREVNSNATAPLRR
jgi:hypothetical protein